MCYTDNDFSGGKQCNTHLQSSEPWKQTIPPNAQHLSRHTKSKTSLLFLRMIWCMPMSNKPLKMFLKISIVLRKSIFPQIRQISVRANSTQYFADLVYVSHLTVIITGQGLCLVFDPLSLIYCMEHNKCFINIG